MVKNVLGTGDTTKTDEFSEKFQRSGSQFQSKNFYCKFWTFEQGFFGIKMIQRGIFRVCFFNNLKRNLKKKFSWDTLGKHHYKNISVHLGIARLGGGSQPLPGWFVAAIFRRNDHVQTGICMPATINLWKLWKFGNSQLTLLEMSVWAMCFKPGHDFTLFLKIQCLDYLEVQPTPPHSVSPGQISP